MLVITANNVNDAFWQGLRLIRSAGKLQHSRAGEVRVCDDPVVTEYMNPMERVLMTPYRDANPVFHLMEALWMLAGRDDARWLDQYVHDFSARFAEDDGHMHGAYGHRWRRHFEMESGGHRNLPDQLETIIHLLTVNPDDRRIVLTMWDPVADLGADKKDVPCNTQAYFRIRTVTERDADGAPGPLMLLDMTVLCRSNDIWWGTFGANAVHFSVLQEYLARRIGAHPGWYRQFSNNFHMYTNILSNIKSDPGAYVVNPYNMGLKSTPIVTVPEAFDEDLQNFMAGNGVALGRQDLGYRNQFFPMVAIPMQSAYQQWRAKRPDAAMALLRRLPENSDWRIATEQWFRRRMAKMTEQVVNNG